MPVIDQVSGPLTPTRGMSCIRAPRRRLQSLPEVVIRSRSPGSPALELALQERTVAMGIATYLRLTDKYTGWREAAAARPVRSVPVGDRPRESATNPGKGTVLDIWM